MDAKVSIKTKTMPVQNIFRSISFKSPAMSNFYGTEIEIWASFGLVGNTEKIGADYEQPVRAVFSCFHGQNKNKIKVFVHCSVCNKKLINMSILALKYTFLVHNRLIFNFQLECTTEGLSIQTDVWVKT